MAEREDGNSSAAPRAESRAMDKCVLLQIERMLRNSSSQQRQQSRGHMAEP